VGTLKRACWLALAVPALLGMATLVFADDGWEARLLRQVEQLESKLKDHGEPLPPTGSIEDRVRAIEGATAKLEKRRGVDPKPETYYEGSSESQKLLALTNILISLKRRIDAVLDQQPNGSSAPDGKPTPGVLERTATNILWGDDDDIDHAASLLQRLDRDGMAEFLSILRKAVSADPPASYLSAERSHLDVIDWTPRLRDPNADVAKEAALELGYTRLPSAVAPLLDAARVAASRSVRTTAIRALEMLGRLEAVPALIDLIADEDPDVGRSAVEALDTIVHAIIGHFVSLDPTYRRVEDSLPGLQTWWREYWRQHEASLRQRSGQTVDSDSSSPGPTRSDYEMHMRAVEFLDGRRATPFGEKHATDTLDGPVLRDVLRALRAEVRTRRLSRATDRQKPWDRSPGAWIRIWIGRIHDADYSFAIFAANRLSSLGSPACLDALIWALREHTDAEVRTYVAAVLRENPTLEVLSALVGMLDSDYRDLRATAYRSLVTMTKFNPGSPEQVFKSRPDGQRIQREFARWLKTNQARFRGRDER
jgi:hypothetical protein